MFKLLIYLLLIYLIWKLLQPTLKRLLNANTDVKGKRAQKKMDINATDIEDAEFRDIDENKSS
jgi:hypothetical protein